MKRHLPELFLVLLLTACGSPKTHFHVLVPVSPRQAATPVPAGRPIEVGHVELPGTLDRQSMVIRGQGTDIEVSDQDRWAAPLDELTRRALTADLRSRLGVAVVLAPGDPAPPGGVGVVALNFQQFSGDSTGRVTLEADWTLQRPDGHAPQRTRHVDLHVTAASGGPDAIAGAMSQALGQLADDIAAHVSKSGARD